MSYSETSGKPDTVIPPARFHRFPCMLTRTLVTFLPEDSYRQRTLFSYYLQDRIEVQSFSTSSFQAIEEDVFSVSFLFSLHQVLINDTVADPVAARIPVRKERENPTIPLIPLFCSWTDGEPANTLLTRGHVTQEMYGMARTSSEEREREPLPCRADSQRSIL